MSTQTQNTEPDTDRQKVAENALEERRSFLQALLDGSFDAVLVTNNEGRYVDANAAACDLLGYTRDELLQLNVSDLTAEPFRQNGSPRWQQFLATGSARGE